ncbi:MAG: hypothetical protein AAF221_04945 [Pseudomonadota bacterium]
MNSDLALHLQPYFSPGIMALLCAAICAVTAATFFFAKRAIIPRIIFAAILVAAALNPQLVRTERTQQTSVGLLLIDDSESQRVAQRGPALEDAAKALLAHGQTLPAFEWQVMRYSSLKDADDRVTGGTRLNPALREGMASVPPAQQAGIVILTDGQVDDAAALKPVKSDVPIHTIVTGARDFLDRRLIIREEPAFAEVGKPRSLTLEVDDIGFAPETTAKVTWQLNEAPPQDMLVKPGIPAQLTFSPEHRGLNTLDIQVEERSGEVTTLNNRVTLSISGVRNRLRVVLVSGEPYQGERLWRSTLKSDPSVDLVHFTILRLPTSRDVTPVSELSLIPFPTQELFEKNLDKFDLVIFDRYSMRGVLQQRYLANLATYVRKGGALLVAVGPEYGRDLSLYTTPLGDVLPVSPRGQILDTAFRPMVTPLGRRHPVTKGLLATSPQAKWGPWYRLSAGTAMAGQTIMEGPLDLPLVVLDRQGEGRVAMVMSDQSWVWGRGIDGGGPYTTLIRRLVHWLMAEPDLEEEHLSAAVEGRTITVSRRSLRGPSQPVDIERPDGTKDVLVMKETDVGLYQATIETTQSGLYRLQDDSGSTVASVGAVRRQEIERLDPTDEHMLAPTQKTGGGVYWAEDGVPAIKLLTGEERLAGRQWMALRDRSDGAIARIARQPLLPAWGWLVLLCSSLLASWWRESR